MSNTSIEAKSLPPYKTNKKRHSGSDGLRVIALFAVAAYHIRPDVVPGGFLAVVIFLVLAGYYTTRSFIVRPQVNLPAYYKRRLNRLWPPLLFLLATLAIFSGFFLPEVFRYLRSSAPSAALGYHNIAELLANKSYFDRHGSFDPLTHLWALSMEMQFYLVFPLLYAVLSAIGDRLPGKLRLYGREMAGVFLFILGIASALYLSLAYQPGGDPTVYYYNSFMRVHAFLNGAAASMFLAGRQMRQAFLWASGRRWSEEESTQAHKPPVRSISPSLRAVIGWICLTLMVVSFFVFDYSSNFLYQGGFYLYSLIATIYIVFCGVKAVPGMGWMESSIFQYFSKRSYHIYLWQYALMVVLEAALRFSTLGFWPRLALQLVLLLPLSEISYRIFDHKGSIRDGLKYTLTLVLALILLVLLVTPPPVEPDAPALEGEEVLAAIRENASLQESARQVAANESTATEAKPTEVETSEVEESEVEETEAAHPLAGIELYADETSEDNPLGFTKEAVDAFKDLNVTIIGDSVMAMAIDGMRLYIPQVYIDAEVSRHFIAGPQIIQNLDAAGQYAEILVVALSTNGDIQSSTMDVYLEIAEARPLIFVNTVVPGTWEQNNNEKLARFAAQHDNVFIADWYGRAKNVAEYFYQDATHPVPAGALVYDQVILECIWDNVLSAPTE